MKIPYKQHSACKNNPYWSCIINAHDLNVKLSIPRISILLVKKSATEQSKADQQGIIDNSNVILDNRLEIEEKVVEYNIQVEREKTLSQYIMLISAAIRVLLVRVLALQFDKHNLFCKLPLIAASGVYILLQRYAKRKVEYEAQIAPINQKITALEQQLKNMNYDSGEVAAVSKRIDELKPYEAQLAALNLLLNYLPF